MILISYVKPNVIINSDKLITGRFVIFDQHQKKIIEKEIFNENFVSIPLITGRINKITVELITRTETIRKQILI
jgi:hypothetical protein